MAITIRNKTTEAMIRKLGQRRGEGPSAVVKWLAERELAKVVQSDMAPADVQRRIDAWDDLMKDVPHFTQAERKAIQDEMDHMYDDLEGGPESASEGKPKAAE